MAVHHRSGLQAATVQVSTAYLSGTYHLDLHHVLASIGQSLESVAACCYRHPLRVGLGTPFQTEDSQNHLYGKLLPVWIQSPQV